MKKLAFLLASVGLIFTACIAEDSSMTESIDGAVIIGASYEAPVGEPGTKATIDNYGHFAWSTGDSLLVYTYAEDFSVFKLYQGDGAKTAKFVGYDVSGAITDVAVTPATLKPSYVKSGSDLGELKVTFPETINWVDGQADPYMVACGFSYASSSLSFHHIGGLIRFTVNMIPVGAEKLQVTIYGACITGQYTVNFDNYEQPYVTAVSSSSSTVTFVFDPVETVGTVKTFYLPVPVMSYTGVKLACLNGSDEVLCSYENMKNRSVARADFKYFPSITLINGGGESSTVYEVNPDMATENKVYEIPDDCPANVVLKVYKTTGTVTINSASGTNPTKVTIRLVSDGDETVEDEVNELDVNLPNCHVDLEYQGLISIGTLNSVTNDATLVIKSGVKVGILNVAQGNARVEGTVDKVYVTANETQQQKTKPEIQVFVAKTGAIQTITLNTKSDVTVEQPQGNIDVTATENKVNVIVNEGAEGSTAVAQNGGDIYVTAKAAVEVEANGHDASNPTNKSTITIDTKTEGATGEVDAKTEGDGVISGITYVAKIDDYKYTSIADAINAANETTDATITLLANCETGSMYTEDNALKLSGANTTLDLNGKTLTVTKNFSFCVTASNVKVQNGTLASGVNNEKTTKVNSYILAIGGVAVDATISGVTIENVTTTGGGISAGGSQNCEVKGIAANTTIKNCTVLSGDYYAVCSQNESYLTIDGGTYTANTAYGCTASKVLHASFKGTDGPEGTISVVAGKFYGEIPSSNVGRIFISGGTFDHNPASFVAQGYEAQQPSTGVWEVVNTGNVAKIGTTEYATLQAAIDACPANTETTITVLCNVANGSGFQIPDGTTGKNIIIDFDDHNYTFANNAVGSTGTTNQCMHFGEGNTLTLKNGTLNVKEGYDGFKIMMQNYSNLTVENMTVNASNIPTQIYDPNIYAAPWAGITRPLFNFIKGTSTVTRSTFIFSNTDQFGITCDSPATLTLGEDNVVNGNVTAYDGAIAITGGTYNGTVGVTDVEVNAINGSITITGGTFANNPSTYVAPGYSATKSGKVWTVAPTGVALVGSTTYATLAAAFAAAQSGDTVTLLKDYDARDEQPTDD